MTLNRKALYRVNFRSNCNFQSFWQDCYVKFDIWAVGNSGRAWMLWAEVGPKPDNVKFENHWWVLVSIEDLELIEN